MANRTRGRDFERRIQRSKSAACGAEQARTAVALLRRVPGGPHSTPASGTNSTIGGA
ncbi:hypothetical protein [Streptomyces sp. NBC_00239]|uniref:hypothetical protein n=1 Tax=Streptomyces sp. NBC_00239 TaxID=2903640 RepID=UPI002E298785|nr:hypothetical protein [Streptomyces sp. NBC_00239]